MPFPIQGSVGKSVETSELEDNAVSEAKIATGAVTSSKLGSLAVLEGKINTGAVTSSKLGSLSVLEGKINTGAVTSSKLGSLSVLEGKINTGAVSSSKLASNSVLNAKINNGAVSNAKVASGISAAKITTGDLPLAQMQKKKDVFLFALTSSPDIALSTGTKEISFVMPYAYDLTRVLVSADDHSSSSTATIDVNDDGSSVIGGGLSLTSTNKTASTSLSSTASIASGSVVTIDVDAEGTDVKGVNVILEGVQ